MAPSWTHTNAPCSAKPERRLSDRTDGTARDDSGPTGRVGVGAERGVQGPYRLGISQGTPVRAAWGALNDERHELADVGREAAGRHNLSTHAGESIDEMVADIGT